MLHSQIIPGGVCTREQVTQVSAQVSSWNVLVVSGRACLTGWEPLPWVLGLCRGLGSRAQGRQRVGAHPGTKAWSPDSCLDSARANWPLHLGPG